MAKPRDTVDRGRRDPGPATATAPHHDETLRFEDPQRLAHRGPGHPERAHELVLRGEAIAGGELAPGDLAADAVRDDLGGLAHAQRREVGRSHDCSPLSPRRIVPGWWRLDRKLVY